MSDFLDRLAARAIGSEAALAPRLPSLFEPLHRVPLMPPADEGEAPAHQRDTVSAAPAALTAAPSPQAPAPAVESMERRVAHVVPVDRAAAPVSPPATAGSPREPRPSPPLAASPVSTVVAERSSAPSTPERQAASPSPRLPRQVHVAPIRQETVRTPPPGGALLPASAPVFTAPRTEPARSGHVAASRAAAARADGKAAATGEPVVHVSIGRLEVRAAPVAAAPSRRREEPRPASLDDYLRQRGKASP